MTKLTLRYIKGDFVVTGTDIEPTRFKTRREAQDWCMTHLTRQARNFFNTSVVRAQMSSLAKQFEDCAARSLELARAATTTGRARFMQMAREYQSAAALIREEPSDLNANYHNGWYPSPPPYDYDGWLQNAPPVREARDGQRSLDDIRRQADVVSRDYEIMMAEARAVFADMDAAHVFAEYIAITPGARKGSNLLPASRPARISARRDPIWHGLECGHFPAGQNRAAAPARWRDALFPDRSARYSRAVSPQRPPRKHHGGRARSASQLGRCGSIRHLSYERLRLDVLIPCGSKRSVP